MQPANAESLLNDWAAQNAFLVVVHRDSVAVAICACVVQAERPSANIADVHIHYVGVHPTFRRLKIAATLLKQLPAILQSSFPPSEQAVRLTAFGDLANEAATALYTSCRFSSGETSVVWQRCLAKS
jgi:ribosomal protein S18 acetylase RimI-like enzyme